MKEIITQLEKRQFLRIKSELWEIEALLQIFLGSFLLIFTSHWIVEIAAVALIIFGIGNMIFAFVGQWVSKQPNDIDDFPY